MTHMLEIERFIDKDEKFTETGFNFLIWDRNIPILNFTERLKWCWKIITTGKAWANEVVLKDYQAQEIASFISEEFPHLDKRGNLL